MTSQGFKAQAIAIDVSQLQSNRWLHLAISGSLSMGYTYMRLDYTSGSFALANSTYITVTQNSSPWNAILGSGSSFA